MNSYTIFAKVYDSFMRDIPYEKWFERIHSCLLEYGHSKGKILDVGCGTGFFTMLMANAGYDMLGIDCSKDMIREAVAKNRKEKLSIQYEQQDMRALMLDDSFSASVSVCDSINYLESYFDLVSALSCIYNVLEDKGLFIFDMKTRDYFESLGTQVFTDEVENSTYIWDNEYDCEDNNNYYNLTFFIKDGRNKYRKYTEEHIQHSFTEEEVTKAATESGFTIKDAFIKDEREYFILERN